MTNKENGLTLEEAIDHCEGVEAFIKSGGKTHSYYGDIARYLRRLKRYEDAIKSGELIWKENGNGQKGAN